MQGESGENNVRKVAVVGLGLIGGSFEKASRRAGYEVATLHHGDGGAGLADADLVLVCLPPAAVVPWMRDHAGEFRRGAFVVDIAGVKRRIMDEFAAAFPNGTGGWSFIGGHPMAGREVSGYANSLATLFDGASMILVPPDAAASAPPALEHYFLSLGFARVVVTSAAHHDEMIAFTSQLCHLISSAYVREDLARGHVGFSAGSFRDLTRVGAPAPPRDMDGAFSLQPRCARAGAGALRRAARRLPRRAEGQRPRPPPPCARGGRRREGAVRQGPQISFM